MKTISDAYIDAVNRLDNKTVALSSCIVNDIAKGNIDGHIRSVAKRMKIIMKTRDYLWRKWYEKCERIYYNV